MKKSHDVCHLKINTFASLKLIFRDNQLKDSLKIFNANDINLRIIKSEVLASKSNISAELMISKLFNFLSFHQTEDRQLALFRLHINLVSLIKPLTFQVTQSF